MNTFGRLFRLTSFGESHGPAMGAVVDGCPAGVVWNQEILDRVLERRRPGQSSIVSARNEADQVEVLSGIYENKTLGTPIAMMIRNQDARSEDYQGVPEQGRQGHADDTWKKKFGHVDPRGGGRSSGRETVARVMGGAVAQMLAQTLVPEMKVVGFASQISSIALEEFELDAAENSLLETPYWVDQFPSRFPHAEKSNEITRMLEQAKEEGLSYGGCASIWLENVPAGLGQPVFHKLKSELTAAMMSVGATAAVSIGAGFSASQKEGTQFHDPNDSSVYGGLRGGISTGERISLEVAFKPTSSVMDIAKKGRHDPCIVPRAIPVLEAMAWLVLADHLLLRKLDAVLL